MNRRDARRARISHNLSLFVWALCIPFVAVLIVAVPPLGVVALALAVWWLVRLLRRPKPPNYW